MSDRIRAMAAARIERTVIAHYDTTKETAADTVPVMEAFLAFARELREEPDAFDTNPSNREITRRSDGAVMGGVRGMGLWGFRTGGGDPSYVGLEIDVPGLRLSAAGDLGDATHDTIALALIVLRRIAAQDRTIDLDALDAVTRAAHASLPMPDGPPPASALGDGRDVTLASPWTPAIHEPKILPPVTKDPMDDPLWALRRDVPFITARTVLDRLVLGTHRVVVERERTSMERLRLHVEARAARDRIAGWGLDDTADGPPQDDGPPDDAPPEGEGPAA